MRRCVTRRAIYCGWPIRRTHRIISTSAFLAWPPAPTIRVQGVDGAQSAYSLSWNRTDYNTSQPGIKGAVELSVTTGTLNEAADVAYYRFDLASAGTWANYITVTSADTIRSRRVF